MSPFPLLAITIYPPRSLSHPPLPYPLLPFLGWKSWERVFSVGTPVFLLPTPPWLASLYLHHPQNKCPCVYSPCAGLDLSATGREGEEEEEKEGDKRTGT